MTINYVDKIKIENLYYSKQISKIEIFSNSLDKRKSSENNFDNLNNFMDVT